MEDPPKGYFRLAPGREVRLRYAYFIRCNEVVKDASGEIVELRCTYDPETRGGGAPDGRKVKGTIHWVSAAHAKDVEVRLYDRLFAHERPDQGEQDFTTHLNPSSLELVRAKVEPSLARAQAGEHFQFERHGYFFVDPEDSRPGQPVFNRTVSLKDSWAKLQRREGAPLAGAAASPSDRPKPASNPRGGQPKQRSTATPRGERDEEAFAFYVDAGLTEQDAALLATKPELLPLVRDAISACSNAKLVANWVKSELLRELKERSVSSLRFGGKELGELVALVDEGTLSPTAGKEVLGEMLARGGKPRDIVEAKGLEQVADPALIERVVDAVLARHAETVAKYRAGKTNTLGFLVGQVLKAERRASPQVVSDLLRQKLG